MKRLAAAALGLSMLVLTLATPQQAATSAPPAVIQGGVVHAAPAVAPSSTQACASHAEYNQLEYGMTVLDVANLFDEYGQYLGDTDTHFRYGYTTCWAPDTEQIVVSFSYDTGWSNNWWIKDI